MLLAAILTDRYGMEIVEKKVNQSLLIVNGSAYFNSWVHMSSPRFASYYVFEVRNPEALLQGKRPIILREVGPFVFQKFEVTENVTFHEDGSEVSFMKRTYYKLRRDKTNMSAFYRNITMINMDFMAIASYLRNKNPGSWKWFLKWMVQKYMKAHNEELFMNKSPHEFILGIHSIGIGPASKDFGVISEKNDTSTNVWKVHTGVRGPKLVGQTISYNDKLFEDCWGETPPSCNEIRGTEGSIFERPVTKYLTPFIYSPDLMTSLTGVYEKEVMQNDIKMLQFNLFKDNMLSPLRHPPNYCYCVRHNVTAFPNYCPSDGILDMSGCRSADVVISQPHFLNGHALFLSMFEGLSPDVQKHESYIQIEPRFGITTAAQIAYQYNVETSIMKEFEGFENMTSTIFPSYYLIETVQAEDATLEIFRKYTRVLWLLAFLPIAFAGLGLVCSAITIALCVCSCFERRDRMRAMTTTTTTTTTESPSLSQNSVSSRDYLVSNPANSSDRIKVKEAAKTAVVRSPSSTDSQDSIQTAKMRANKEQIPKTNNKSFESITSLPSNIIG
jgi:hypothetical protein